jgi:hypothetical protein
MDPGTKAAKSRDIDLSGVKIMPCVAIVGKNHLPLQVSGIT